MKILFLLFGLLLAGCAACGSGKSGVEITRNIVFSRPDGLPLALDLYVPKAEKPLPVVVWIHGGGWKIGSKNFRLLVRDLTKDGFAVASIDYRLSRRAKWPAQREDCIAAIRWLRENGAEYRIDPTRMALSGDSAGGHLSALIGLKEGKPKIRAVVALYPPTDLVKLGEHYINEKHNLIVQLFGGSFEKTRAAAADASPVNHISDNAPPFLIIHGDRDTMVPLDQSTDLAARLREAGIESRLVVLKGRGHAFGLDRERLDEVAAFLRQSLD
jgi:acetyl esterase/lipase